MENIAVLMRLALSANWANIPYLRSMICDSTWACTEGHAQCTSFLLSNSRLSPKD